MHLRARNDIRTKHMQFDKRKLLVDIRLILTLFVKKMCSPYYFFLVFTETYLPL